MEILLLLAVLPVVGLCYYVYDKDINKEPKNLLTKLFIFGVLSVIPILVFELLLDSFFPTEGVTNFVSLFINIFIAVALVEEGFKWLVVKIISYNHNEFDEVYDIIVYSVFASLGFACLENIFYVLGNGFGTAIVRALLSVPGHACFGVMMGYFLSKAKVAELNKNSSLYVTNTFLSILVPVLLHTIYDALLFYYATVEQTYIIGLFFIFDIAMVVICFITVHIISRIQQNLKTNVAEGTIINNNGVIELKNKKAEFNYCPVCGNNVANCNYCSKCGFKIK